VSELKLVYIEFSMALSIGHFGNLVGN